MAWTLPSSTPALLPRVSGEGPRPCRVMVIGEYPGIEEGKRGRPFMGKSGREFARYLDGYLRPTREQVYLTNLSKRTTLDPKQFAFTPDDERELWDEIGSVRPQLILTLGMHSTKYFLGEHATLEAMHGIPHAPVQWQTTAPVATVLPCYNPAAMLHSPKLQAHFALDMAQWSLWLKGRIKPPAEDAKPGQYSLLPPGLWTSLPGILGIDSEGWEHDPWCLSYSGAAYTGEVVRFGGHEPFIGSIVHRPSGPPRLVIHNALHDFPVFRRFGLDVDAQGVPWDDTMVMAYLLGLEPQGLKPLAYRHAGMTMQDYADLTADASESRAFQWLMELHDTLPDKATKLTKREAVALGLWPAKGGPKYEPISWPPLAPDDTRRAHAKSLIGRMLEKPGGLRTRWAAGTAREILSEELTDLPFDAADPPEATLDEVPLRDAVQYAARDADATLRVYPHLRSQIAAYDLEDVYAADIGTMPMIDRMQTVGLGVDLDHFRELVGTLQVIEDANLQEIARIAGRPLNPNSGDQVAAVLFDELKLQESVVNLRLKRTKTGDRYSTNDKVLEALSGLHPLVGAIQYGREVRKLRTTYAEPIPRLIGRDGRLHPRYRITRTETGRLSAADPNVLALPKHSELGTLVRMGFVADDFAGHELGEWDLAQIEMCIFAHDSRDERMIAEIVSGLDKHAATAAGIFGRPAEIIYAEAKAHEGEGGAQRFAAKAVNFGILMGITAFGLLDQFHKNGQLQWTLQDCEKLLADWYAMYPGGKAYIEAKHAEARRYGFVRDMWNRLRWLEGVHSPDDYIRAEAERQAQATPIQSGAQGVIKRVMVAVWPVLKALRESFWVEPLLQVHDALQLEYMARERATLHAIMTAAMTETVHLRVPIKCSASFGLRMGEL